jgi:ABC-type uncharacterized transport system auxiliary subunit
MTARRAVLGVAAPAAFCISACFHSVPPLALYRLQPADAPADSAATAGAAERTIAVAPYATLGIYSQPSIVYRTGGAEYGSYPNAEWAIPLASMLADLTATALRSSPDLRLRVATGRSEDARGLVWRGTVRQFEEVDSAGAVAASVQLDATVLRASDESIVWQGTASLQRRVERPTMPAVVDALAQLANDAARQLVGAAAGVLRADTVPAPRT